MSDDTTLDLGTLADEPTTANILLDLLDPLTVEVPADGVLQLDASATIVAENADPDAIAIALLLDYDRPDTLVFEEENVDDIQEFYDSLVGFATSNPATLLSPLSVGGAREVTAGTHTVRLAFHDVPDGDDADEETALGLFRSVSAECIPNGTAPHTPRDASELFTTAPAAAGSGSLLGIPRS